MRGVTVYSVSSYGGSDRVGHLDGLGTLVVLQQIHFGGTVWDTALSGPSDSGSWLCFI